MDTFFGPPPPSPAREKEIREGEMNNEHNASKQHPTMYSIVLMTNCMRQGLGHGSYFDRRVKCMAFK